MLGAAWMGFGAGCLPRARGKRELALLAGYAVVSALLYGMLLNLWFWPFGAGHHELLLPAGAGLLANLHRFVLFDLTTSLGFDIRVPSPTACWSSSSARPCSPLSDGRRAGPRSTPGQLRAPLPALPDG